MYESIIDKWQTVYFQVPLTQENSRNLTWKVVENAGSLLNPTMNVTPLTVTPFTSDLTKRDDVLLAFMSLWLLLLIEGLVTTFLLRTRKGKLSTFRFSVKQVVAFVQELNWNRVFANKATLAQQRRRLSYTVILFASGVILVTFGLEVAVLFLTEPEAVSVDNTMASYKLLQPVMPDYHDVRFHFGRSIDLPCEAFVFFHVDQGTTRINGCVSSSVSGRPVEQFPPAIEEKQIEIVTDLHRYGAEHTIRFKPANASDYDPMDTATFSTRVFFTLADGRARVMEEGPREKTETLMVEAMHKQYIAYLYAIYGRETREVPEGKLTLEDLNNIRIEDLIIEDPPEDGKQFKVLMELPNSDFMVPSRRYTTTAQGLMPSGISALRVAHHFFRGCAAISVQKGNTTDFFIDGGMDDSREVIWMESRRIVNWLTLSLILITAMLVLAGARWLLRPVATADIAGAYVQKAVQADRGRSPVEMDPQMEKSYFIVDFEKAEYTFGAETNDRWDGVSSEYNESEEG